MTQLNHATDARSGVLPIKCLDRPKPPDDVTDADGPAIDDEAGSDVRDTLVAYFMTPEGRSTRAF